MSRSTISLAILILCPSSTHGLVQGPWSDRKLKPENRAQMLINNLTLDEKLVYLSGDGYNNESCTGNVPGNARLDIPPIRMNDGPQGFRDPQHPQTSTAWPSGLTMAATWDVDAMMAWGAGQGEEFFNKGANTQLGPGLCIARVPENGRNFEYLSGEDPFLGYTLARPAIEGIQSQKVLANAKHWVLNNQETDRGSVSAEIDERTRHELYYPPYEGAIAGNVASFMCGYNKINGRWSCENPETLHELKQTLGFKGFVMSDWGATHSMSIMEGLDIEMPNPNWMIPDYVKPALLAGSVTESAIDDTVLRILTPMFSVGIMDEPASSWDGSKKANNVSSKAASMLARNLSALSTVLLKNDAGILPLAQDSSIAVIGLADDQAVTHGGGSGKVTPSYVVSPLEGIKAAAGKKAAVRFDDGKNIRSAASVAKDADFAIVFVGTTSHENADRTSLSLDDGDVDRRNQNALITEVAKANSKTIVVASVPGATVMPWSQHVSAILTNFMPGQQAGNAIADVLFGTVNPSARLPVTFPNIENETAMTTAQWPGIGNHHAYAYYTEKLLVGYRYYEAHNIAFTTGFPFGHGLSYTTFKYTDLRVESDSKGNQIKQVSFSVKNIGTVPGAEVAQLYLRFPHSAGEPFFQLKGLHKTRVLDVGDTEHIVLKLSPRDMSIWDSNVHAWSIVPGTFEVRIGSSSRDFRLTSSFAQSHHPDAMFI